MKRLRLFPPILLAFVILYVTFGTACATRRPTRVRSSGRPTSSRPPAPDWAEEGIASWYGGSDGFEGKPTASGEIYDGRQMTAAHRELPLGTIVEVTNLDNGRVARVRVNDRGPFIKGRILDLSRTAARELGVVGPGIARVRLAVVTLAPEPPPISPDGLWAVQVGSFADRSHAERHAERVRGVGRAVYLEPYRGLSRVKVGPFESRERARDVLSELEAAGFEGILAPASGVPQ